MIRTEKAMSYLFVRSDMGMKLKAYILHNHAATIQRSPIERDWIQENEGVYANFCGRPPSQIVDYKVGGTGG